MGQGGPRRIWPKCCLIIAKSCECRALNGIVLPIDIIGWFGLGQSIAREARHQVMSCCRCNLFTGALLLKCISRISRPHFFKTKKICPRSSADLFNSCQRVVSEWVSECYSSVWLFHSFKKQFTVRDNQQNQCPPSGQLLVWSGLVSSFQQLSASST